MHAWPSLELTSTPVPKAIAGRRPPDCRSNPVRPTCAARSAMVPSRSSGPRPGEKTTRPLAPPPGRPTGRPLPAMCPGSHVAGAADRSSPPGHSASAGSCCAPGAVSSSKLRRPAARRRRRHRTVRSRSRSPPRGCRPARLTAHPRRGGLPPWLVPSTGRADARRRSRPRPHPTGPPCPDRPKWRATRSWASWDGGPRVWSTGRGMRS